MEENNVSAPAQSDAPAVDNTPAPEPVQNTQVQETQTVETNTEAPLETNQTETVSESQTEVVQEAPKQSYPEYDITQFLNTQPSTPEFTPDENGYIDPKDFYNRVMQDAETRIEQKLKFQEMEKKVWQQVENRFPEIKEDSELRDILNAQRIADVASGGKGDLNKIAEKLLGKIQSYQQRGKAQAQVSEKVQKSAALESNTANTTGTNKSVDLMERMSRGDQVARNELISQWLADGKI
jgi:hypothetical protein